MDRKKIDRINELGRIAKERELTELELAERAILREEYIRYFRKAIRAQENITNESDKENEG